MSNSELAVSYAALILADADVDPTPDKLQTLIKAANVDDVEPIWATLFAKALEGKNVKDLLINVGSGGGAASAPTGDTSGRPVADDAVEEAKKEEKEEGKLDHLRSRTCTLTALQQRKRNRTKIWALDSLTKFLDLDHSFGGSFYMTRTPRTYA
ncbi:hypothetical protein MMC29_007417 [Sticta canariensis]|nr:hypothetical protein [Sticta canariensis]